MNSPGTPNMPSTCDLQNQPAGAENSAVGTPSNSLRRRILSYNRVSELVSELIGRRFYGRLVLQFKAGYIVCAKPESSNRERRSARKRAGQKGGG